MKNASVVTKFILLGIPYMKDLETMLFVLFLCFYIFTLMGNLLILLAIVSSTRLHTPMYFFLCQLSVCDIFFPSVSSPKMLFYLSGNSRVISYAGCVSQLFFYHFLDTSALEMVGFISVGLMPLSCFFLILTSYSCIVCSILQIRSTEGRHRAFSTCSAHLTAILLSFMPVVLIYLQPTPKPWLNATVHVLNNLVTPMLNPLIYSLRNKEVKYSLRKVLQQAAFLPEQ
ncbi:olfactory receptor 149-like [Suricata suricatta]|uniref:olfactory receptor 149-like n=1 Tax=Suricata suricatta TaxID=37032 RepID=UPI0011563ADF|nr:olfactory receptor 149-like [Suricata suricatta]